MFSLKTESVLALEFPAIHLAVIPLKLSWVGSHMRCGTLKIRSVLYYTQDTMTVIQSVLGKTEMHGKQYPAA